MVNDNDGAMKHIFIINPCAGKADSTKEITAMLSTLDATVDYGVYVTRAAGDATDYVADWCRQHAGEAVRFYACGGDGTLNEVASGLIGRREAELACFPSGSGNDYIKYYGSMEDFTDVGRLLEGRVAEVDIMRVQASGDSRRHYSVNVCNFGFDAEVCRVMTSVRRKPVIGGRNAYTTGVVKSIFTGMRNRCNIKVDGELFNDGEMLLCTLANGRYVGGQYQCAPQSVNDDGLIEVNLFRPISLLRFATLIGDYSRGTYVNRTDIAKVWHYRRGRVVELDGDEPFYVCVDGEMLFAPRYRIENLQRAVRFVVPKGL